MREFIYQTGIRSLRYFWKVMGGRRINAFGEKFIVAPPTNFPTYRKFPLPKGDCLSEIVTYTDFVQLHAVCNAAMQLEKQTIIDVDAYRGAYAVVLGKLVQRKEGKVIAVEPVQESYAIMTKIQT